MHKHMSTTELRAAIAAAYRPRPTVSLVKVPRVSLVKVAR